MKKVFLTFILIYFYSTLSFADNNDQIKVEVDLSKLPANVVQEILKQKNNSNPMQNNPVVQVVDNEEFIKKYVEFGKVVALTLKEVCQTLNVEVNAFVKTPVGMLTTGLIVYKVIGKDIIRGIIFFIYTIFLYIIIISSFMYFHKSKRVPEETISDDNPKVKIKSFKYVERFHFKSNDAKTVSTAFHVAFFLLISLITYVTI